MFFSWNRTSIPECGGELMLTILASYAQEESLSATKIKMAG
jgi:hypothetical protein